MFLEIFIVLQIDKSIYEYYCCYETTYFANQFIEEDKKDHSKDNWPLIIPKIIF